MCALEFLKTVIHIIRGGVFMRKRNFRLVALLLTLILTYVVFAAELPQPRIVKDRPLRVGYLYRELGTESAQRNYRQVKIEAAHRGWDLIEVYAQTDEDRRNGLNNLINQNVDAIIFANMPMVPLKDLIIEARERGIGTYNVDTELVPGIIANVTQPNGIAGLSTFYPIAEKLNWEGNFAIITVPPIPVNTERTEPVKALINNVYPGLTLLGEEYIDPNQDVREQAFNFTKRWITKYGDKLDVIFSSWDGGAKAAANAIEQAGYTRDQIFSVGIDGGSETWSMIRKGTPFKYSYAQPFELYDHVMFDLIEQIQIQGIMPGDEGSMISNYGQTIYKEGRLITPENVPQPGQSVHAVFDYYGGDPDDPYAWYNWQEEGGPYLIE
jgi:ABC-type sugar transport system substrate-binding protein